jgi:glycosyltransferase involved in cell wall biosynthesis
MNNEDNKPLVSIVISMYDESGNVGATLESIFDQEYENIEIIIIDDGSDDDSVEIARDNLETVDYKYSILENATNIGQSFSQNRGAMHVDGKYVIFHDADDVSTPNRLRKQVEYLESHPEVGVLGGGYFYINPNRNQCDVKLRPVDDESIRTGMARECMINLGTAMFRREALFETDLFRSWNVAGYELFVNIGQNWKLANLPEPIYLYRINEGSRSQQNQLLKKITLAYRSYQAIEKLDLPYWYLPLQFGWLIYMYAPQNVQEIIRGLFSPTEERSLSTEEKRTLEQLQQYE